MSKPAKKTSSAPARPLQGPHPQRLASQEKEGYQRGGHACHSSDRHTWRCNPDPDWKDAA